MQEIVVVGGGFAGFWAAMAAAREADENGGKLSVTLVSDSDALVNRPRLYERDPARLTTPLRPLLTAAGIAFVKARVAGIDSAAHSVQTDQGTLPYDRLVLATGSRLAMPAIPGVTEHAFDVDTLAGALRFDRHLADNLRRPASPARDGYVVLGAGFTGIELACELRSRLAVHDVAAAESARILLVDRAGEVGSELGSGPRPAILAALAEAGVETRLDARIAEVTADAVLFDDGERLPARTLVVTTGMRASPLTEALPGPRDDLGRLVVDRDLRLPGAAQVFAAGDVASARTDDSHIALMSCQHAMPMGRFAGYNAARDLLGLPLRPYAQPRYVTCLDLGRAGAVFTTGWERTVAMTGAEAKALKRQIVEERIALPPADRQALFAAAALPD